MGRLALGLAVVLAACGRTEPLRLTLVEEPPDAGTTLPKCTPGVVTPTPEVASVIFVIDRSGSMLFDFAGNTGPPFGPPLVGPQRWAVLRDSLGQVLPSFDRDIAMGVTLFPSDESCGSPATLALAPQTGNASAMLGLLGRTPSGGTPTSDAIGAALGNLKATGAQALVLITDGEPNCNARLNRNTCACTAPRIGLPPVCPDAESCLDDSRTIETIRRARVNERVVTYVIGIASETRAIAVTLDNMAIAGGAPRMGAHQFYSAASEAQLTEALRTVSARVTRCTWSARRALGSRDQLEVRVGDAAVPADGWRWVREEEGAFSLLGEWCDRAEAGAAVTVRLTCSDGP